MTITENLAIEILYQHSQYCDKTEKILSKHFFNGDDYSLKELSDKLDKQKENQLHELLEKCFT